MEVVLAGNGQEALDVLARDSRFDGVLMDCQMPVMDGYTATREIRRNPALAQVPVVAMTANAMAGDREKALDSGMVDHIAKPLDVRTMFVTMAKWIRPRVPANAAPEPLLRSVVESGSGPAGDNGLQTLPGIDIAAGLSTALQSEQLYKRLLRKFRDGQRSFGELFRAARSGADATAAERAAHTLKGVAGNIGARGVQAAAGELERACHEGAAADALAPLLSRVLDELEPVIAGLAGLDPIPDAPERPRASPLAALDPERIRTLSTRLEALLAASDTDAAGAAEELERAVAGTPAAGAIRGISSAIAEYDFDAALAALKQIDY
jgi:CheY-like chemotaxis protein